MPAISRMARSGALTIISLALTGSTLAVAPAHAADDKPTAFVMSEVEAAKYEAKLERRQERSAQRFDDRLDAAVATAMAQRGDAYSYGASGPNAFDCSGLIYFSYRSAGFDVPRTSSAQAAHTRRIAKEDMQPGDLMFFGGYGGVYHAGIFVGWKNGTAMMLHAPGSGRSVVVEAPWTSTWFGGTLR